MIKRSPPLLQVSNHPPECFLLSDARVQGQSARHFPKHCLFPEHSLHQLHVAAHNDALQCHSFLLCHLECFWLGLRQWGLGEGAPRVKHLFSAKFRKDHHIFHDVGSLNVNFLSIPGEVIEGLSCVTVVAVLPTAPQHFEQQHLDLAASFRPALLVRQPPPSPKCFLVILFVVGAHSGKVSLLAPHCLQVGLELPHALLDGPFEEV